MTATFPRSNVSKLALLSVILFSHCAENNWCIQLCWYCVSLYRCSVITSDHVGYFGGPFALPFLTFIEGFAGESTRMNAQHFNKEFEAVGQLQEHHLKIRFMPVKHWQSRNKFLSVFGIPCFSTLSSSLPDIVKIIARS